MNRYDTASVAKFNPMSFQEIMLAPSMMRQKHDASIAAAEAMRLNPNPLNVHYNRALELKQQMDGRISSEVDRINKEGFNPNTTQNITKLNREYQDLIASTGEIGQINNAKIVYDTEKENFLKSAEANKLGRDQALKKWAEKTSNYTGFGEDGKSITNVTPQGVAAFQDYGQQLSRAHSILGETIKGFPTGGGYHLEQAPDGGTVFVDKQGSRVTGNNARQVESAYKSFRDSWINGEGAAYARDAGLGIDEERIRNDFNSMLKYSDIRKEDINRSYSKPEAAPEQNNYSVIGEDYNTQEIGGSNQDFSELEKIGVTQSRNVYSGGTGGASYSGDSSDYIGKKFKVEDIKDLRQRAVYENMYKKLSTTGVSGPNGKNIRLKDDFIKKGMNDPEVAKTVLKYLKEMPPITLTSKLLTANQLVNSQGFVAGLGTTADDVDKNIRRQLQRGDQSGRKLVDPKTGQTLTWNEAAKKYGFENINDVNYHGQISAHNWEENESLGSNSKFSPHVVTIKDKNGNWTTFKTTRLNSDNLGGNPARMNDLTTNFREATLNYGEWVNFKSDSPKLKDIKIKYNPSESEVDQYTGEPKSWEIQFKNGQVEKTTEGKYMNWVNSL